MKLKDKVAVVTGAGSGIGRATALLFAQEGARVAVVDVREDAAKATAQEIERAGGQALALRADVSRGADNQAAVEQTVARWGRLDMFCANAGVPERPTPGGGRGRGHLRPDHGGERQGPVPGREVRGAGHEEAEERGHPDHGSTAAIRPRPGGQSYAASKGAAHVLAKSLALELAPFGVRVVAIAPVATETPMLPTFMGKDKVDDEGLTRYRATVPLGRLNQPEDLARAALFLASDDAAMITGSAIEVDGGRCI